MNEQNPPLIMVVEDQPLVRDLTCQKLVKSGYGVISAEHGGTALEILRARGSQIKAIVLDQEMTEWQGEPPVKTDPAMRDGDEFIREALKEKLKLPPIIVHSASLETFFQWMEDLLHIERKDYMKTEERKGRTYELPILNVSFENKELGLRVTSVDKTDKRALDRIVEILESLSIFPEAKPASDLAQLPSSLPEGLNKTHSRRRLSLRAKY